MGFAYGLLGIRSTISENLKEKQQKATLPDPAKVLEGEMECKFRSNGTLIPKLAV